MSDRTLFGFDSPTRVGFTPLVRLAARPDDALTGKAGAGPEQMRFGPPKSGGPSSGPGADWRVAVWAMLRTAWRRQRTRHCLLGLDPYLLKDIGITYAEAEAEANKPFWVA